MTYEIPPLVLVIFFIFSFYCVIFFVVLRVLITDLLNHSRIVRLEHLMKMVSKSKPKIPTQEKTEEQELEEAAKRLGLTEIEYREMVSRLPTSGKPHSP